MKTRYFKSHLIRWLFSIIGIPKDEKKLLKELKFTIGEQYENYEFDLQEQGSKTVNGLTYEIYLYTKGTSQTLFGLSVKSIFLYFNGDILSCVEYELIGNNFEYLKRQINKYLPRTQKMRIDPFIRNTATTTLSNDTKLELLVHENTNLYLKGKYY